MKRLLMRWFVKKCVSSRAFLDEFGEQFAAALQKTNENLKKEIDKVAGLKK